MTNKLQVKIKESEQELLKNEIKHLQKAQVKTANTLKQKQQELSMLEKEIINMKSQIEYANKLNVMPTISEHAIVRYLERFYDIDIDAIRNSILTDSIISMINSGVTKIKLNTCTLVIEDKKIVTIY